MAHQFKKHYTVEEARALLPQVRQWLAEVRHHASRLSACDKRVGQLLQDGRDAGGGTVNEYVQLWGTLRTILGELAAREIILKDPERGLVDFPALIGQREVFLCWEDGEDDIEYWHDLDSGYAGREKI